MRGRATPPLSALLAFRDAKTCDQKHALLDDVKAHGDSRILSSLQPFESVRGCGFLNRSDCYPCMHHDHLLYDAIQAINERTAKGQ